MRAWIERLRKARGLRRARRQLVAPMWRPLLVDPFARAVRYKELRAADQLPGPTLAPYERLAAVWDEASEWNRPDYPGFLPALARLRGVPLGSALDLACGTGGVTVGLAGVVPDVAGLDVSPAMLDQARANCPPGVALHQADFRDFDLGRTFDAAVCASNSLNYVRDPGELADVFRCVTKHLNPGGLFVFDTTTEAGMRWLSGKYQHAQVGRQKFALRFRYDPAARRESAAVLFAGGVEPHDRVPLDLPEVRAAAAAAGLDLVDHFSPSLGLYFLDVGHARFFVLAKPG